LIQVFKRNDISAYIALLLVTILCKLKFFLYPTPITLDAEAFKALFFSLGGLKLFYEVHPFLYMMVSILLQYVFAIVLNTAMINHRLFPQKNMLIGLAFVLITSFFSEFNYFSTAFIANFFLTIAFVTILKLSTTSQPRQRCFNIGLLMGLASFFYFPSIVLFVVFLFFIWLLRPFVLQEAIAYFLGFISCFYGAIAYLYLTDHLLLNRIQPHFHFGLPTRIQNPNLVIWFAVVFIVLLIRSAVLSNNNVRKEPMIVRKKWRLVYVYLIFATVSSLFSSNFPSAFLIVALTPFSILLSQSFNHHKEKWNIFTLLFILLSILGMHWVL
jgi:hypothetical protein